MENNQAMNKSNCDLVRAISQENETNVGDFTEEDFCDHRISWPTGLPLSKKKIHLAIFFSNTSKIVVIVYSLVIK